MWEPRRLRILWASTACYRDTFTFMYTFVIPLITCYMPSPYIFLDFGSLMIFRHAVWSRSMMCAVCWHCPAGGHTRVALPCGGPHAWRQFESSLYEVWSHAVKSLMTGAGTVTTLRAERPSNRDQIYYTARDFFFVLHGVETGLVLFPTQSKLN
jgi:hypothetical protein